MSRKKQTGWHKDPRLRMGEFSFRPDVAAIEPTRWERMLRELGVTDAQALGVLEESRLSAVASAIREWVREHCRRAFVPEPVLTAMGLGERDVLGRDLEAYAERGRRAWAAQVKRHSSAGLGE